MPWPRLKRRMSALCPESDSREAPSTRSRPARSRPRPDGSIRGEGVDLRHRQQDVLLRETPTEDK
jgi:hypothetical protein